jgi:hypothetical protein
MQYEAIESQASGDYMKLTLGENRVRIVSLPEAFGTHFDKAANRGYICHGESECSFCAKGEEPKKRFYYHVIDRKDGAFRLMEVGFTIIDQIKTLRSMTEYAFADVPPYDAVIKKEGAGLDTTYTVTAARANTALTAEETAAVAKLTPLVEIIAAKKQKEVLKGFN